MSHSLQFYLEGLLGHAFAGGTHRGESGVAMSGQAFCGVPLMQTRQMLPEARCESGDGGTLRDLTQYPPSPLVLANPGWLGPLLDLKSVVFKILVGEKGA